MNAGISGCVHDSTDDGPARLDRDSSRPQLGSPLGEPDANVATTPRATKGAANRSIEARTRANSSTPSRVRAIGLMSFVHWEVTTESISQLLWQIGWNPASAESDLVTSGVPA